MGCLLKHTLALVFSTLTCTFVSVVIASTSPFKRSCWCSLALSIKQSICFCFTERTPSIEKRNIFKLPKCSLRYCFMSFFVILSLLKTITESPFGSANLTGFPAKHAYGLSYSLKTGSTFHLLPNLVSYCQNSALKLAPSPSTSLSASCPLKKYRYPPLIVTRGLGRVCSGMNHGAKIVFFSGWGRQYEFVFFDDNGDNSGQPFTLPLNLQHCTATQSEDCRP